MAWINASELRGFVKNVSPADEGWLDLAVEVACGKVEDLCGPVEWTAVVDEHVELAGTAEACLKWRATRGLVAITSYPSGATLNTADYRVDGQVLSRRDHGAMGADLLVSYNTGYFDASDTASHPPAWAKSMALHIAQQYLRTMRRFGQTGQPADGPVGFLVPNVALEVGADHLLSPGVG